MTALATHNESVRPSADLAGPEVAHFSTAHADRIAGWVASHQELFHLAPSTPAPLTGEKVTAWTKRGGHAFVLLDRPEGLPLAYGELNQVRNHPDQLWIGHVVTDPTLRRHGFGRMLVENLVRRGFDRQKTSLIKLIVFPDNAPAIRCYERVGFFVAGHEFHRFPTAKPLQRVLRMELSEARWRSLRRS